MLNATQRRVRQRFPSRITESLSEWCLELGLFIPAQAVQIRFGVACRYSGSATLY
jgi:hypothetical protein